MSHFCDLLARMQGLQDLPKSFPAGLLEELRAAMPDDPDTVTSVWVRAQLKQRRQGKFYPHSHRIACQLRGNYSGATVKVHHRVQEELKKMFLRIQRPFEDAIRREFPHFNRRNFLNYNYVFNQLTHLLSEHFEFPEYSESDTQQLKLSLGRLGSEFPLLKSHARLGQQDLIWASICKALKLPFRKLCPEPTIVAKQPSKRKRTKGGASKQSVSFSIAQGTSSSNQKQRRPRGSNKKLKV